MTESNKVVEVEFTVKDDFKAVVEAIKEEVEYLNGFDQEEISVLEKQDAKLHKMFTQLVNDANNIGKYIAQRNGEV